MFPLTIRLKKKLHITDSGISSPIIEIISAELLKLKVSRVKAEGTRIYFENDLFNGQGRWHVMSAIDRGYFDYPGESTLVYRFSTARTFFTATIISGFFAAFSWSLKTGILIFLWLYWMNWIICVIRQSRLLKSMASQITKAILKDNGIFHLPEAYTNKLYPLQLWLTTMCVATPILMIIGGLVNKDCAWGEAILLFAIMGIFFSLPVFVVCYLVFLSLATKRVHAIAVRAIVAIIAVLGVIISFSFISGSSAFLTGAYYCCGVVVSSLFFRIYKQT